MGKCVVLYQKGTNIYILFCNFFWCLLLAFNVFTLTPLWSNNTLMLVKQDFFFFEKMRNLPSY